MITFIREYFLIIVVVIIVMLYKYSYYAKGGHELYEKEKSEYNSKHPSTPKPKVTKEEPKVEQDKEPKETTNSGLGNWGGEFEESPVSGSNNLTSADSRVDYESNEVTSNHNTEFEREDTNGDSDSNRVQ